MLNDREHGYSVMNKELNAFSFEDISLETCKKYCRNGDVIARKIPYIAGFAIRFLLFKPYRIFEFSKRSRSANISNIHFFWNWEYLHKTGKVVYRSHD